MTSIEQTTRGSRIRDYVHHAWTDRTQGRRPRPQLAAYDDYLLNHRGR